MTGALPVLLAIPAAGAAVLALAPVSDRVARATGVVASAAALVVAVVLAAQFDYGAAGRLQDVVNVGWLPSIGVRFHLGVDGISLPLVLLTALLTLLCAIHTVGSTPEPGRPRHLLALVLVLELGVLGTFVAADLIVFFVFFEIVLIPMYFLINVWGGPARHVAAVKFILYTLLGSALMLVGFLVIYSQAGTFDMVRLGRAHGAQISSGVQLMAFVLLMLGFGIKSPMWPLHTWLPDAHTEAPTVGSVLLAGVLLKMGTYGLIRIAVDEVPDGARRAAPALAILAVVGIVYAALACLAQRDLKRLVAFSSVGHMGFVLLGIATLTPIGLQAALIGNVAHGVITGLLFFLAGAIKDRAHTGVLTELGGLRETAPGLAGVLGYAAIASLGLPGLAGFWGEAFAVVAALRRNGPLWTVLAVLAALGAALAAAYFLRLLRQVTHGPPTLAAAGLAPPGGRLAGAELFAWSPLVVLALLLGVLPAVVLNAAADAARALAGVVR